MRLYLAGGISGNLRPAWSRVEQPTLDQFVEALNGEGFLAGGERRHYVYDSLVKEKEPHETFLAGAAPWRDTGLYDPIIREHHPFILESFYYVDDDTERLLPLFGDFLLDSGAFTFMQNEKSHCDWDAYVERYAAFIKKNDIRNFFELDIDSVAGYGRVLELRKKLELLAGRRCIPVWHKSRGIDEYYRMCEEYDRVAIGGIVSREIRPEHYGLFPKMIKEAHRRGAQVHGLGFTSLAWLPKCHFDSVDSTAWTTGNRFGFIYRFDGEKMQKVDCPPGMRLKRPREVALINYTEWIKFQKYAETNL